MTGGRATKLANGIIGIGVILSQGNYRRLERAIERMRGMFPGLSDDQLVDLIFCFGLDFHEMAADFRAAMIPARERMN